MVGWIDVWMKLKTSYTVTVLEESALPTLCILY